MKQFENFPKVLKDLPQWVCHRNKIPLNPVTGTTTKAGIPKTWAKVEAAENASGNYDGIGFEFHNIGIVGVDLEHVFSEDGTLTTEAMEIVSMLDSYT